MSSNTRQIIIPLGETATDQDATANALSAQQQQDSSSVNPIVFKFFGGFWILAVSSGAWGYPPYGLYVAMRVLMTSVSSQDYYVLLVLHVWFSITLFTPCLMLASQQSDKILTLSVATQTLHLKRSGLLSCDVTLPLAEIIDFSSAKKVADEEEEDDNPTFWYYIVVHTTSVHLKLPSSDGYCELAVTRLNQFLTDARNDHRTPDPHRLFPGSDGGTFRLTHSSNSLLTLPSQSQLSFVELQGSSFKCIKRRQFPKMWVFGVGVMLFLWTLTILISLLFGPITSFAVFVTDSSVRFGSIIYIIIVFSTIYFTLPSTWIFEASEEPKGWLRAFLNRFWGVTHIPVRMHKYIEVDMSHSSRRLIYLPSSASRSFQFRVFFVRHNGGRHVLLGFCEGEIMVLMHWLRQRFPSLFDLDVDGNESGSGD